MHTPQCDDGRRWWPSGAPADINSKDLPAAGLLTYPLRLYGEGNWMAFWGPFQGLRVGISGNGQSYPVTSGACMPYPKGIDIYLSMSPGGFGTITLARFQSREAGLAFAGTMNQGGPGASIGSEGTDVFVNDFTASGGADQISNAATVLLAGGASAICKVIINRTGSGAGATSDLGFAYTNAVAVTNNPIGPAGQDVHNIPIGGKLFMKGAAGQTCSVRVRS